MQIETLPVFPEQLELTTWCSGKAKTVAERTTTVSGDMGAAARAEAIWVHVNPETRRPTRLPAEFEAVYGPSAGDNRPRSSLRHPPTPPEGAECFEWTFGRAEIDLAGHVSNLWYWKVAEEFLDLSPIRGEGAATLEAEFRSGIGLGTATVHRADSMLWVSDPDGTVAGTLSISSGP